MASNQLDSWKARKQVKPLKFLIQCKYKNNKYLTRN